jgi:hypothetical protein
VTKQCQKLGITPRAVGPIMESSVGTARQPTMRRPSSVASRSTASRVASASAVSAGRNARPTP